MGEPFTVEIESIDLDGRGVARRDGKAIFVEGALPGERARALPLKVKPSYETARMTELLRGSALRAAPRCPHFGIGPGCCGGCAMQHLEPRAQVAVKQRALEDALWHLGRVRAETMLRPIHGPSWQYRYRARFTARMVTKKGGVLVGFHERGSSYVADMRECHVVPAHVSALLLPLRALVATLSLPTRLPQIELAVAECGGATETVLVFRVLVEPTAADRERLAAFGRAHGVTPWLQPGGPETAQPLEPAGRDRLRLELPEFGTSIPFLPTDFTQVNHGINEVLVRRALRLLDPQPHERIADFFCGLGNFTLPIAKRAAQVVGLEGHAGLVARARAAAADNGLAAHARFAARNLFQWTAADWQALNAEGRIDAVLVDPPREGALAVVQALVGLPAPPRRLVYVSCNPATLARDAAVLVHEAGWRLVHAGVVNMFPHTAHVESIAVLAPGEGTRGRADEAGAAVTPC